MLQTSSGSTWAGGVADRNKDAASYEVAMQDSARQQTVHDIPGMTYRAAQASQYKFIDREECMQKMNPRGNVGAPPVP